MRQAGTTALENLGRTWLESHPDERDALFKRAADLRVIEQRREFVGVAAVTLGLEAWAKTNQRLGAAGVNTSRVVDAGLATVGAVLRSYCAAADLPLVDADDIRSRLAGQPVELEPASLSIPQLLASADALSVVAVILEVLATALGEVSGPLRAWNEGRRPGRIEKLMETLLAKLQAPGFEHYEQAARQRTA